MLLTVRESWRNDIVDCVNFFLQKVGIKIEKQHSKWKLMAF